MWAPNGLKYPRFIAMIYRYIKDKRALGVKMALPKNDYNMI